MTTIVRADQVKSLLPLEECIKGVENALKGLEIGTYQQPLRFGYKLPQEEFSILANMPSFAKLDDEKAYCCNKCITVFPSNSNRPGKHSHQGVIMLFEAMSGKLLLMIDATTVTSIRTAAASAIATKLLHKSKPLDSSGLHLCLLGCGALAMFHLEAMLIVRPNIRKLTVWNRTESRLKLFVQSVLKRYSQLSVICCSSVCSAVENADIICTLTAAVEPLLKSEWVKDGAHINAVGSCTPNMRELDSDLIKRGKLYTDSIISCVNEPGDVVVPLREGIIENSHILGTIGHLLVNKVEKSNNEPDANLSNEVTIFESLGLAVEDLAAALIILRNVSKNTTESNYFQLDLNG
eukprot:GSMAST32.ASY1.ANO1.85.1 assembled CDS